MSATIEALDSSEAMTASLAADVRALCRDFVRDYMGHDPDDEIEVSAVFLAAGVTPSRAWALRFTEPVWTLDFALPVAAAFGIPLKVVRYGV